MNMKPCIMSKYCCESCNFSSPLDERDEIEEL